MAPRSRQVMLSCPSSLQGHSDFPTPIARLLPVSSDLNHAYRSWGSAETLGSQVLPPLSFTACRWPYPGSPVGALALYFPTGAGLLPIIRGSACIPIHSDLSLLRALPATSAQKTITRLYHSLYATACGFGRPPWLGTTRYPASLLGTVSGQVQPMCHHMSPPSAYISKRATDMVTSFQVTR